MPFRVDRSPKAASKLPPMYSPRIDGGGVLASRVIPPSPLSKGLDGPIGSIASPSVDYDDVFGGPPRFATSTFATPDSQGHATLDRAVGRAPSFRSPALPVFELPVFGDEPLGGSNTYEPRPASVTYDDIFREELHVPDVYQGSATYGNLPRSRASSRSTSRRMSPLHPAASLTDQLLHEEICAAANSGVFSKSRSTVGKVEGRNSFSSPVYDDTRSKPLDPVFMVARNESVGSSLPASPPHNTTWGHVKRFTASKSVHNLEEAPANVEVDDVFGGFPRRTYPSVFQGVNHDFPRSPKLRNAITKGTAESDAPRSPQIPKSSEPYGGLTRTLSSSSSSDGEKELQDDFIEIRMDKQNDAAVAKKAETGASRTFVTVSDLRQSAQLTSTKVSARPPPAPAPTPPSATGGVIKQKSWKDWTLNTEDSPSVNSYSSRVTQDSSMAFGTNSTVKNELDNGTLRTQQNKSGVESFGLKHLESNSSSTQSPRGKFKIFSPLRTALRAKPPVVDTMQLEERQLHTMLNNAWKNNEQREEKKNSATSLSENSPSVTASLKQDHSMKGGKKKPSKPLETPLNQQMFQKTEQKQADLRWKSWKKPHSKEKFNEKDSNKVGSEIESKQMKAPGHVVHDITEERADNGEKCNLSSECEDSFDPEEFVKVVTEELSANGPKQEVDQRNFDTKSSTKRAEDSEIIGNEKPAPCEMDINKVASARTSRNGSFQDFGEYSEQQEVIFSEGLEEYDCLTGLDALQLGFQDIDGESVERRKARWVRHLRAKERAAKALEEMQQRDAEVLREQAEKQQLAENADRQIKRWATGKEGNLRALLSNLQHVLWSESGWKPISLTDLIEGPDVKKAYRKATLFVHPDKLQQKGATLQQKYIAERVFDILQEAWKTFNLQELF